MQISHAKSVKDFFNRMATESRGQLLRRSTVAIMAGALLILGGIYAVGRAMIATLAATYALGGILLFGGICFAINAIFAKNSTEALLDILACALYFVAGVVTFRKPLAAAGAVTLVLSAIYVIQGIARISLSFSPLIPERGWVFFSGLVTLFLGGILFAQWPASSLWLLGLLVGIDMIFCGWTMILRGAYVKHFLKSESHIKRAA